MARLVRNPVILPPLPIGADIQNGPTRRNLWRAQSADLYRYGAFTMPTRAIFDSFAHRDDVPGATGVREVKFLIVDVNMPDPILYLMNMNAANMHYAFAKLGLGHGLTVQEFNRLTYFAEDRSYLAGSIIAHDSFTDAGGNTGYLHRRILTVGHCAL